MARSSFFAGMRMVSMRAGEGYQTRRMAARTRPRVIATLPSRRALVRRRAIAARRDGA